MPPTNSPSLRQRRLGAELRKLREHAGLTTVGAADLLGVNQARISMIETGRNPSAPTDSAPWPTLTTVRTTGSSMR